MFYKSTALCILRSKMSVLLIFSKIWNSETGSIILVRPYIVALVCEEMCKILTFILSIYEANNSQSSSR